MTSSLSVEQLQSIEHDSLDSLASIASALSHNLILGLAIQSVLGPGGMLVPSIQLIFHPDAPDEEPRRLVLTVPLHGTSFLQILSTAGKMCEKIVQEFHQKTGSADAHYQQRDEIGKLRRNNRKSIIMPSRS